MPEGDIDDVTGDIDENVLLLYDDAGDAMWEKYVRIRDKALAILAGDASRPKCDGLLKEFHRTVEYDNVPKWEAATGETS